MDGAVPGDLPPELVAVQASLMALIAAARCTLDAVEAVVAEPRTFAIGASLVQQAAAVTGPLVVAMASGLFAAGTEPDR